MVIAQVGAPAPSPPPASVLKMKHTMYADAAPELPSPGPSRGAEQWGAADSPPREFPGAAGPSTEAQTGSASTSEVGPRSLVCSSPTLCSGTEFCLILLCLNSKPVTPKS